MTYFKILITRFSVMVSLHTGVQTKLVTLQVYWHGSLGS